jgi:uncharacterized protein YutE (UPF0331/DUF86 family)
MADDVVLSKAASIERCVARIREVYADNDENLWDNHTTQDSILLNLQRACELSIDLAMHVVRKRRLGVPGDSREAFDFLQSGGILDAELAARLKRMVGFRNVAIHEYAKLDMAIVKRIITERLNDFLAFTQRLLKAEA